MSISVKGKVIIITGAGRGIGQECAEALAADGAKVVIAEILADKGAEAARKIKEKGNDAIFIHTDVTKFESTKKMAEEAVAAYGRIDVLVNNAALYGGLKSTSLLQLDEGEWDRVMNINVKGIWNCVKAVAPHMSKQGKGKIVNISSIAALRGTPFMLHYTTSKGAVYSMTKALAVELPMVTRANITVNSILPGLTFTEASINLMAGQERAIDANMREQCVKRNEEPQDLVGAVMFLASDASNFMTGSSIVVDGGVSRY